MSNDDLAMPPAPKVGDRLLVTGYGVVKNIGPPPGLEEVRAKLEALYGMGFVDPVAYGHSAAASRLIAELLAMFEAQPGRLKDRQKDRHEYEDDLK